MSISRRQFFRTTTGMTAALTVTPTLVPALSGAVGAAPDLSRAREDFPWLGRQIWLSAADYHPICIHALRAMEQYAGWRALGPGDGRANLGGQRQRELKEMFGRLINAQPTEIAFVQSTTDAENLVVSGLDLPRARGNVVIDDLHYQASKYMYRMLAAEAGLELRVVNHRDWRVDIRDMERAIDRDTRLVSLALVSNINGYLHDVKSIADLAHAHGTYLYADIIQAAGAVPIDVREMGIDFAGCGAYKWLMGDFGFGFLYVREELQGEVLERTRWGVRQFRSANQADSEFDLIEGAAMYESGSFSNSGAVCAHAALQYLDSLGVDNIRAHVRPLVDRLQREMPALGYEPLTPADNPTPIVSFRMPDPDETQARLNRAFGEYVVAPRRWEFTGSDGGTSVVRGLRISPSVYNNQSDLDRLFEALS